MAIAAKAEPDERQQLSDELNANEEQRRQIIQQISDRAAEGRPRLAALDDMLDRLDERRADLEHMVRQFIQKVVIGKTPGHQPASLEVHGRIATILAALEATTILDKQFTALKHHDYLAKLHSGEASTEVQKRKLLDAYAEELSVKRLAWANLQVSVVAGAGFEPAAFRL